MQLSLNFHNKEREFLMNTYLKGFIGLVMAMVFVVIAQATAQAQVNDLWIGDTTLTAHFGGKSYSVAPDSDANTGQVVLITNASSVENHSQYWHAWAPATDAYKKAWINELLRHGCVENEGCGSVRLFWMNADGVKSEVYNQIIPVETVVSITPMVNGNHVEFHVEWSGGLLWNHSLAFGDGAESVYGFDGPAGKKVITHDYPYTGGSFPVTLTIQTGGGPVVVKNVLVIK